MVEPMMYSCNMCSFNARSINSLTSHVCRAHKTDSMFHVYCKSCLRSYTKWDSYRKHVQRGCNAIPIEDSVHQLAPTNYPLTYEDELDFSMEPELLTTAKDYNVEDDWHEAVYILNIKEKYLLSQVAVDQVLSCTKQLVSDILAGVVNNIRGSDVSSSIMNVIENEIFHINSSLFKRVSTASLQKNYFKEYFNLVVSKKISLSMYQYSFCRNLYPLSLVELLSGRKGKLDAVLLESMILFNTFHYYPL